MDGNEKQISVLYRQLYGCMMAICVRYQKDEHDAKAVMNDSFLKIINNLKNYNSKVPFMAWVRRIVINNNIDVYRREKRMESNKMALQEHGQKHADRFTLNEADLVFDADELLDMINQLPKTTKEVFNLFAIDGYSHKEIGEMLDISDGTSKWHVSNARKKLMAQMNNQLVSQNIAI